MSSVRMCDSCSQVFSEREEGWSTGSGTMFRTNKETGRKEQIQIDQDLCADCTELRNAPRRVSLPLEGARGHYDGQDVHEAEIIDDPKL